LNNDTSPTTGMFVVGIILLLDMIFLYSVGVKICPC